MPGAMTAMRGFMGRSPIWRRRCAQSADIVAPWQGSLFSCPAQRPYARAVLRREPSTAWQWRPFRLCSGGIDRTVAPVEKQETPVPDDLAEVRYQVALANRMLANEGVLDALAHVTPPHPTDPARSLLSRSPPPPPLHPAAIPPPTP